MRWKHWARITIVALAGFLWVATGCTENKPTDDISDDSAEYDDTGWTVVLNYDEFPNIALRCFGPDRVYVNTRQSDMMQVIPDHPSCREPGDG